MGINIGALLAPLITGYLGEDVGWHYGFGAAGVGMVIGLIWYRMSADRTLGAVLKYDEDLRTARAAGLATLLAGA